MKEKTMVRLPYFADPANLKVEEEEPPVLPEGIMALELLQLAYRGQIKLTPQQARCAIEALPFESAKISAVAIGHFDGKSFAEQLDRAIERSKQPLPAALPAPDAPSPQEPKGPMVQFRRF
jgi:hypothetical protein